MRYKVFTLTVKFTRRKAIRCDFTELKPALEAAWELRDCKQVEYMTLRTEWREPPEWLKRIVQNG